MTNTMMRGQIQLRVWGNSFPMDALRLLEEEGYMVIDVGDKIPESGQILVWAEDVVHFQQEAVQLGRRFATAHVITMDARWLPPDYRTFFRGEVLVLSPSALQDGLYERRRVGQMAQFRDTFGEPAKMAQLRPYYGSWEDQYVQAVVAELMKDGPLVTDAEEVKHQGKTVYGPYQLIIKLTTVQNQDFTPIGRAAMLFLRVDRVGTSLMGVKVLVRETDEEQFLTKSGTRSFRPVPEGPLTFEFSFVHGLVPARG